MVSIIIPSFNREQFIAETLDSVLSQQHKNWECLIIDDGSTDQTINIITQYVKNDDRFSIYRRDRQPKGANTCRNIGIEHAKGDFLLFLDSDDILDQQCLSQRIKTVKANPQYDIWIFPMGSLIHDKRIFTPWNKETKRQDYLNQFLELHYPWSMPSGFWKKGMAKSIKFDETLTRLQDPDFHIRALMEKDIQVFYAKHLPVDVFYRTGQGSKNSKQLQNSKEAYENFFVKFAHLLKKNTLLKSLKKGYKNAFFQLVLLTKNATDKETLLEFKEFGKKHGFLGYSYKLRLKIALYILDKIGLKRGWARIIKYLIIS